MIATQRATLESGGAIAAARASSGQHSTPADGFALDLEALERATERLLERALLEDWSIDAPPESEP